MVEQWPEPARVVPVLGRPDVLVVGAGSAGVAAAIASARRGARTWLIEGSGTVGGLATAGLINLLLTMDDGCGHQVVRGVCQEFVDRLDAAGLASHPPPAQWGASEPAWLDGWRRWGLVWGAPEVVRYSVAFDPEDFVDVSLAVLGASGVRLRLYTWFAGVAVNDGRIEAVLVESKAGRQAILPAAVVDATGDGDVLAAAGAPCEQVTIPPHLWFRVGGVDHAKSVEGSTTFQTVGGGRDLVPWGPHPDRVDACDPDDVTRAVLACRRGARAEFDRLRVEVPAFAGAWLDDYAGMLGITESRRLVGDYVLTKEDGDVRFPDAVAQTGHWTRREVVFDIPLRCLTAPGFTNVLASGRCVSASRYVHQATKEIPAAMATGEAAGAAAAHLCSAGALADVHDLDVAALRRDLEDGGASVGGPMGPA